MEYRVAQLGRLVEKLGGPGRIIRRQRLHLLEDVEELSRGQGVERAGDRVGAADVGGEVFALGQRAESGRGGAGRGSGVVAPAVGSLGVVAAGGVLVRLSRVLISELNVKEGSVKLLVPYSAITVSTAIIITNSLVAEIDTQLAAHDLVVV